MFWSLLNGKEDFIQDWCKRVFQYQNREKNPTKLQIQQEGWEWEGDTYVLEQSEGSWMDSY